MPLALAINNGYIFQSLLVHVSLDNVICCVVSGCLQLLVELVHGGQESQSVRKCAAQALHNLVHCHTDDKRGRREARVLRLVEQIQEYCCNITSPQPPELGTVLLIFFHLHSTIVEYYWNFCLC